MSADTVDDLHAAEDEIGNLRHVLACIVGRWDETVLIAFSERAQGAGFGVDGSAYRLVAEAISAARVALAGDYCRPSCTGRLPDEATPDDDQSYGYCDECCGCPCHNP